MRVWRPLDAGRPVVRLGFLRLQQLNPNGLSGRIQVEDETTPAFDVDSAIAALEAKIILMQQGLNALKLLSGDKNITITVPTAELKAEKSADAAPIETSTRFSANEKPFSV
jgi:hypothetical protein